MKILLALTRSFNPNDAGVQRTTFKLGKYFTEQGIDVAYFSTKPRGHVPVEYGELFHLSEEGGLKNPANIDYLKSFLTSWQPDIVINQMPYEKELRQLLAQQGKELSYILVGCLRNSLFNFVSNIAHSLSNTLPTWKFQLLNNRLALWGIKQYHQWHHALTLRQILDDHDCYVLLCPPNREELNFFIGEYQNQKVEVIPNSIPAVFPQSLMKKEKEILYVGSLNIQQKRADLLLEIWEKAFPQLDNWRFRIVGHGEYSEEIKAQIEKRNLRHVYLEGFQKPEPYYEKAALFVMTSAYEGFPNTILEAHSYGCPVVAFNSYLSLSWIVNDGEDAELISPFDTKEMADRLVRLARDTERLQTSQRAALENAKRFTIDKVGQMWLELFERLNNKKKILG